MIQFPENAKYANDVVFSADRKQGDSGSDEHNSEPAAKGKFFFTENSAINGKKKNRGPHRDRINDGGDTQRICRIYRIEEADLAKCNNYAVEKRYLPDLSGNKRVGCQRITRPENHSAWRGDRQTPTQNRLRETDISGNDPQKLSKTNQQKCTECE